MIVDKIEIEKFRNITKQEFKLGKVITLLVGQNGVGKSSILGLIGQPFGFYGGDKWGSSQDEETKKEYSSSSYKDIYGMPFETVFSEIFRLSKKYDHPDYNIISMKVEENKDIKSNPINKYYFSLKFINDSLGKESISCYTKDRGKNNNTLRFVLSEYKKSSSINYATLIYPVKYLGLNRAFPITELNNEEIKDINFSDDEKLFFEENKNYISLSDEKYAEQILKAGRTAKTVVSTDKYDYEGMSLGQDNISKIITTIISFKRLKNILKEKYIGEILLIDEIEATLFPKAQENIINFLYKECQKLKIQVIATTHSLSLVEYVYKEHEKLKNVNCIFLKKRDNMVIINNANTFDDIKYELTLFDEKKIENKKIKIFLEDDEAKIFLKNLISRDNLKHFKVESLKLDANNYINLYQHKFSEIQQSLIILDGDMNDENKFKTLNKKIPKNFIFLPGKYSPEKIVYKYLKSLSEKSEFWERNYTKQKFINDYRDDVEQEKDFNKERVLLKKWFNKRKHNWGKNCSKFFKFWKKDNEKEYNKFKEDFENAKIFLEKKGKLK
ncbi:ATP-binding protein [Fusobacterium animalis]|uniref:AAA family ATPase n=1 Tax=Fusobacterium animalis TaxID=76859 RepID=UPI0030CDCACD